MKFIIGEKLEMTQMYSTNGHWVPVTKVHVPLCVVSQIKTVEHDGYSAVQLSCGHKKHITKPLAGHLAPVISLFGNKSPRWVKEFCTDSTDKKVGDIIKADAFIEGEDILVRGISKGKGFAGVVKRHHFSGHPATHGHKDQVRMPGSITSKRQGPVRKGHRMGGHMGVNPVLLRGLRIIKVDAENGFLYIKGAVPGARGGYLEIFTK
ncbi:MAG: large subunit ribosomal protein L3 [Parcubacteria group bacterium Gr01-1014_18]|nr:MAG: large subunit ribosomal protein L3 [Parcubacteria group bacterium Greene0416_36]TSC80252.1 MAG: large subunit ribosomal protein L3 [Parcubacteria group bacterium Gr01-1014_18]TSC98231.1 MAG: large subunit ribosomal protein L3 [Parcubacteria group bacterium Greene1014_20]TSD07026.1 MAG: large subunit ribosomal protein L3 [Parcubacteria group bacterium Greene0714_2]